MSSKKNPPEKLRLHHRNKNRERYDLAALILVTPELSSHVKANTYGVDSIDFSNAKAVKLLNKALLNHYYGIKYWEFPDENLCPPIPGRADYLHHIADLLCENNYGRIPEGDQITCMDVGLGANCIYPIIGVAEYGWKFIGSDIDPKSIESAQNIVSSNPSLKEKVSCVLQEDPKDIFHGILGPEDRIDVTICNPPFHASKEDAEKGSRRKVENLSGKKVEKAELNFAGISNELICDGGEKRFIHNMIRESRVIGEKCFWFTSLVAKEAHLKAFYLELEKVKAHQIKTIPMGTGNKSSRILAWSFLSKAERKEWRETRWKSV